MAWILPVGFDRADGTTLLPLQPWNGSFSIPIGVATRGKATPAAAVKTQSWAGNFQPIDEQADSPEIERAEQATFSHRVTMPWITAIQNYLPFMGRGTFTQDKYGNVWRILSSKVQHTKGDDSCVLSYVAESISFDSPPDEFQCLTTELGIDIIKHPRYFYALYPTQADYSTWCGDPNNPNITVAQVKQGIIIAIQTYRDAPFPVQTQTIPYINPVQSNIIAQLTNFIVSAIDTSTKATTSVNVAFSPSCLLALAAGSEIIGKLWNQEDTPYMVGFQITWSQYYFSPPFINGGAYIESPIGIVPAYFLSPSQNYSNTIFDDLAQQNPQCFSADGTSSGAVNISWLRQADEIDYQRTWFKITRKWIGSAIGAWDAQLFSQFNRPSTPSDYQPFATNL